MGTNSKIPLTHRFERLHLLDVVRVEVLELKPYSNSTPRMNRPAGTEKPRSWKAMNDTTNPLGARHGLTARAPSTPRRR
jgi:hypothetical protein